MRSPSDSIRNELASACRAAAREKLVVDEDEKSVGGLLVSASELEGAVSDIVAVRLSHGLTRVVVSATYLLGVFRAPRCLRATLRELVRSLKS